MPADPVFNERAILAKLRREEEPVTPNEMRTITGLVLVCAFDRRVEHDFFVDLLNLAAEINIDLSAMEKAGAMRALYIENNPGKEPVKIDATIDKMVEAFFRRRQQLADKMDLISQCPTLADKIS